MGNKIKVLHIDLSGGGVQTYISNIVNYIDAKKFSSIMVLSYDLKKANTIISQDHKLFVLKSKRDINPILDLLTFFKTIIIVKRERPDIIHCHSAKGGVIGRFAGKLLNIPTIYTPNAFSFMSTDKKWLQCVYLLIEKAARKWTNVFLATSKSEYNRGIKEVKFKPESSYMWTNPIPDVVNEEKNHRNEEDFFCVIARPSYQKNLEMLIEVMRRVVKKSKIRCIVIGAGKYSPNKEKIKKMIVNNRLSESINMHDWIPHQKTLEFMAQSLFLVSTSRYEGLPFSMVEALALGKAIIATDVDGNRDCVQNNYNGYLVDLNSYEEMAKKIIELSINHEKRKKLEINSRKRFEQDFNIEKKISEIEQIYSNTVCLVNNHLKAVKTK